LKKKLHEFTLSGYVQFDNEDLATFTTLTHLTSVHSLFLQPSAMPIVTLIPKLTNLRKLNLNTASNILVDPNPIFRYLTNLRGLDIRIPSSESIKPQFITGMTNLRELKLVFQQESKFPSCLHQLDLRDLRLKKVANIPPSITKFTLLNTLGLQDSDCDLPKELAMMTQLQKIEIQINRYTTAIPDVIFQMTWLTALSLSTLSTIKYIPPEISRLVHLKSLIIAHCSVLSLSYEDLSKLSQVNDLNLQGHSCQWVPPQLASRKRSQFVQGGTNIPLYWQDCRRYPEFAEVHMDLYDE
jgi:hypothetical protein